MKTYNKWDFEPSKKRINTCSKPVTKVSNSPSILQIIFTVCLVVCFSLVIYNSIAFGLGKTNENYLTFTAQEANSSVTFKYASGTTVQYSIDGTNWANCKDPKDSEGDTISLALVGDSVHFKGINVTTSQSYHFSMSGKIQASGDVTSLTNGVGGDATMVANSCDNMFCDCSSLLGAPSLPAITLAEQCYKHMFMNCTSLTSAPTLPAQTLEKSCYLGMFYGCSSLTSVPALPAQTLAESCYTSMFQRCNALESSPELSAITLAPECCKSMFMYCKSLKNAPTLHATTLEKSCYSYMFFGCTNLETAPALTATTLASNCYYEMFYSCSNLKIIEDYPQLTQSKVLDFTGVDNPSSYATDMFQKTGGSFSGTPATDKMYYYYNWEVTYDSKGGSAVTSQYAANNTTITKPADPTLTGFAFGGWYTDSACTLGNEFNFTTTKITKNTTLYAKWGTEPEITDLTFIPPTNLVYDGLVKIATFTTEKSGMGNIIAKYSTSPVLNDWTTEAPKDAGTYYVMASISVGTTYIAKDLTSENWKFTITKATPVVKSPTAKELTYSGEAQDLIAPATTTGGTLNYAVTDDEIEPTTGWATTLPQGKDAGTYYVWYRVDGGKNYNDVAAANITVSVAKAEPTLTVIPDMCNYTIPTTGTFTYEYNGDGDISVLSDDTNIANAEVDTASKTVTVTPVAVGTAQITVLAEEGANYNEASTTHSATIVNAPENDDPQNYLSSTGSATVVSQTGDMTVFFIFSILITFISTTALCIFARMRYNSRLP